MSDKAEHEGMLKEYESLRSEILQADRICIQMLTIAVSVTGIIIGQGISSKNAYLFLIPLPILWLVYRIIMDKHWGVFKIGSYIRCRLELRGVGLGWETALQQARGDKSEHVGTFDIGSVEFWFVHFLGCGLLYLFWRFAELHRFDLRLIVPVVLFLAATVHSFYTNRRVHRCGRLGTLDSLWNLDKRED